MIIFFDITLVAFAALFGLLLICGIFSSMIEVYDWFIAHIAIILIAFIIKTVLHCILIYVNTKPKDLRIKQLILALVTNVLQISSFWIFIKEMSGLQSEHPIVTIVCTIFAIIGYGFPLFISLMGGIDEECNTVSAISNIICCTLFIIACFIPSLGWKVAICIVSGLIGFLFGGIVGE